MQTGECQSFWRESDAPVEETPEAVAPERDGIYSVVKELADVLWSAAAEIRRIRRLSLEHLPLG